MVKKKSDEEDWMTGSWDVLEEENELELLKYLFSTKHVYALQEVRQFHHDRISDWLSTYVRTVDDGEEDDRPVANIEYLGFQVDQRKLSSKTFKSSIQFAAKHFFSEEAMEKMNDNKLKKGGSVIHNKKIQTNSSHYLFCPNNTLLTNSRGLSTFWTTLANTYKVCTHPTPSNTMSEGDVKELKVKKQYDPGQETMLIEVLCSDGGPTARILAQRAKRPFIK